MSPTDARLNCNLGFLLEELFGERTKAKLCYEVAIQSNHARSYYYYGLWNLYSKDSAKSSKMKLEAKRLFLRAI